MIAPPDANQGYDLSGFDLSDLNDIRGELHVHGSNARCSPAGMT